MRQTIKIKNCNCISEANISIQEGELNIKYGPNGTGKTSISEAIYAASQGNADRLGKLKPYSAQEGEEPTVEGLNFSKVRVFDENYIQGYLLKGNTFFEDSFQVFLKSDECDALTQEINTLLSALQGMFFSDEIIQKLRVFLPTYFNTVKCSNGNVTKRGGISEFLKGNGAGFEKYSELDSYKPYYLGREMAKVSKWARWRNEGISEIVNDACPFCTNQLNTSITTENQVIEKVFKSSALQTANAVLEFLESAVASHYIEETSIVPLRSYIGDATKSDELYAELQHIASETEYLQKKIEKICLFRPMNITREQLDNLELSLEDMRIDKHQIARYYTTDCIGKIVDSISGKIDELKTHTGKLKGLFIRHDLKLTEIIKNREEDIADFFALAGFPYKFVLQKDGENKAKAYLMPIAKQDMQVSEPKERLSWGERNAFSLVMFMFEALSDKADLIVLDDPISAFDENKKFAIIRRLFDNQKASFRDKTVLMLTHDMQPIIDYVHGKFFVRYGLTTRVSAVLIQNDKGVIQEQEIKDSDLMNVVTLTETMAKDISESIPVRIVNLRKHIEITEGDISTLPAYDILSNLIHGRTILFDKSGNPLTDQYKSSGMEFIRQFIPNHSYEDLLGEMSDDKLKSLMTTTNYYYKTIAARLLLERKEGLLQQLRKEFPAACKFLNESNHIENDYVFQLDPRKFYSAPKNFISEIESFVSAKLS
ncbi:MAG: AAA family ATPase [Lachnospiraceae bacterium]|nr:AAA family ATPase [Lachnospiraceae bacterium]